jgi:teichoic acid transport system permease protein
MIKALVQMCQENFAWRHQIGNLAITDLIKTCRGAVLGWSWLLIKPLTYIGVFWFALDIGLRAGGAGGEYPYILWLASGLIPWFFMQDMLSSGSNVYKRYSYLVNKISFPLSAISSFYVLSGFIVFVASMLILILVAVLAGVSLTIHVLQLPFIAVFMYIFFVLWSILTSPLSALSKDFHNLIGALTTPIFWLSGIIFDVSQLGIPVVQQILAYNPVTFFATAIRASLCDRYWLWEQPAFLLPMCAVFLVIFALSTVVYGRLNREVADAF